MAPLHIIAELQTIARISVGIRPQERNSYGSKYLTGHFISFAYPGYIILIMTEEPEEEQKYREPMPALAIIGMNFGALLIYLTIIINSNSISDSTGAFILTCHLLICIAFAVHSKRIPWWISACIVALPLFSVLTHH